jgi:transposase-like protein
MNLLPVLALQAIATAPELRLFRPEPPVPEPDDWAEQHFGAAQLGDPRRSRRLVTYAAAAAEHPSGSIPQQAGGDWSDTKATYRLFDNDHVTFAAVCSPHWQATRQTAPGCYLLLGDTTEVDFGGHRDIADLGPLGNGSGLGFLLHSALLVGADTEDVFGLAGQVIHHRQPAPAQESAQQRRQRDRESMVWTQVIDQVGQPPPGSCWVHVLDRGADNFEVFCHVRHQQTQCVVRASCLHRKVQTTTGLRVELRQLLAELPLAGDL